MSLHIFPDVWLCFTCLWVLPYIGLLWCYSFLPSYWAQINLLFIVAIVASLKLMYVLHQLTLLSWWFGKGVVICTNSWKVSLPPELHANIVGPNIISFSIQKEAFSVNQIAPVFLEHLKCSEWNSPNHWAIKHPSDWFDWSFIFISLAQPVWGIMGGGK